MRKFVYIYLYVLSYVITVVDEGGKQDRGCETGKKLLTIHYNRNVEDATETVPDIFQ